LCDYRTITNVTNEINTEKKPKHFKAKSNLSTRVSKAAYKKVLSKPACSYKNRFAVTKERSTKTSSRLNPIHSTNVTKTFKVQKGTGETEYKRIIGRKLTEGKPRKVIERKCNEREIISVKDNPKNRGASKLTNDLTLE